MSKKGLCFLTAMLCSLILTACGISEENLNKVTLSRDALKEQKELTEQLNGNLTSADHSDEISALSAQYDEFAAINLEKLRNKDVEELIPRMDALTDSYKELSDKINNELEIERSTELEMAKQLQILCHIENLSGSELSSICFKDVTTDKTTENYLAEGTTLPNGRILAGVVLPLHSESDAFCLIVTDTLENVYEYALNLSDYLATPDKELSIKLNVPENGAEIN